MPDNNKIIFLAEHLSIGYGNKKRRSKELFSDLNFKLYRGEVTCILGPNGIGKSTLLKTMSGFVPKLGGSLKLGKRPVEEYNEKDFSGLVSVVLTDNLSGAGLTVFEFVSLGRYPYTGFLGFLKEKDKAVVNDALISVGIYDKSGYYVSELSDGERQKVLIAKAFVQETLVIILDEPTSFLDVSSRIEIMSLLHNIAVKYDKAVLLSSHAVEQVMAFTDKLWLLKEGRIICGVTEDVIMHREMDNLYGHDDEICFDYLHGFYLPFVSANRTINIVAPDDVILHWLLNALNRRGYFCYIGKKEYPYLFADKECIFIFYKDENNKRICTSFEELFEVLKQINN